MGRVTLQLFGGLRAYRNGGADSALAGRKAQALLAYLALNSKQRCTCDRLATLLWSERGEQQARQSLRQAVRSLRKALDVGGAAVLVSEGDRLTLDPEAVAVDVQAFERLSAANTRQALEQASALYAGDLLEGLDVRSEGFERWLAGERARFRELAADVLERLSQIYADSGEWDAALGAAQKLLVVDPLHEEGHRILMRLHDRTAVVAHCSLCGAANRPNAKFCSECGERLVADTLNSPEMRPVAVRPSTTIGTIAERRQLTIMFYDLVGSTMLAARLDPEDLREIMGAYHRCVTDVVTKFGGFVARYMGDGALIFFGYPLAHEDDVERAIRAGLEAVEAVSRLRLLDGYQPRVRIGIATGLVVVGDFLGAGSALGQDVAGETANLAARLQTLAEPNTVVIAASTRRLAGGLFDYRDLGPIELKGFSQPVHVWQVLGASTAASSFEARRETGLAPLVGREEELALLLRCWQRARDGEGWVVLLSGEPGIGKSHLAAALLEHLRSEPHARLRYFCSLHQKDSPLDPCIKQLEHAAGFARGDSTSRKLEKLAGALAPESERADDMALIADLLSLPNDGRYPKLRLAPQKRRQRTMEALLRQLELLSLRAPVLMIFEDAHWIDPTSREFLDLILERIARLAVLLIVTFRPGFEAGWSDQKNVTRVTLNPLSRQDCVALVERITGRVALPKDVVDDIVDRADGVPLFLEELTKAVLESGVGDEARRSTGIWASPGTFAVPATLHASLLARLDRLGPAKEIAQIGAAIGREFSYELFSAVARKTQDEGRSALERLVDSGLVFRRGVPPHSTYVFKHALVQDAAYGTMLRDTRRGLHQMIAEVLEGTFPDIVAARPELLAHHFTEARFGEKAIGYWLAAGRQALARSAMVEATTRLRRGLQVIDGLPRGARRDRYELEFQLALGKALIATKGYTAPDTIASFERARRLCDRLNQPPQLVFALNGQWTHALMRNEMALARHRAEELLELGRARNNVVWEWMGCRSCGVTHFPIGDFIAGRDYLERGLALYETARHSVRSAPAADEGQFVMLLTLDEGHVVMLAYLSWILLYLGYFDQARARRDAALHEARLLSQAYPLAHALNGFAYTELTLGGPEAALRYLDELAVITEEHSISYYRAMGAIFRGWCMAKLGQPQEGVEVLTRGLNAYRNTGTLVYVPAFLRFLADAYRMAGQPQRGLAQLDEAARLVKVSDARGDEAEMHRVRGELLLDLREEDAAEASFWTALSVARRKSAKLWELRSATDLARLWHHQGRRAEARDLLAPVSDWFKEGLDAAVLMDAKALLEAWM